MYVHQFSLPCISFASADARTTARIALFTAALLRRVDEIALHELGEHLIAAADKGRVPRFSDNSHLVRIMNRLGWRKHGYAGDGATRSPVYRRVAADALAA
ncbi:hypothetical protein [Sphingobium sp.]|uniref:hypothetical protein n=1 Tax=Sphingobium sp. TaxID=1912891 RepID=UPI003BB77347